VRRWLREQRYRLARAFRRIPRPSLPLPHRRSAKLTRGEADELFPEKDRCQHCGCWHDIACPRVRRVVFRGEEVASVEFWAWREWPRDRLVTLTQKEAMIGDD
jgi:hypothetical protein